METTSSEDRSELLSLLPLINRTAFSVVDLKEFGYTKTQLIICIALFRCENLTMSQVARYISSSKEQATRAVAPLVDDGIAERYVDSHNRTRIHIRLTDLGKEEMMKFRSTIFKNIQTLLREKLTQEELVELWQATESMIRLLSKLD